MIDWDRFRETDKFCFYCDLPMTTAAGKLPPGTTLPPSFLTVEHIIPKSSRGKLNTRHGLAFQYPRVDACQMCNNRRGDLGFNVFLKKCELPTDDLAWEVRRNQIRKREHQIRFEIWRLLDEYAKTLEGIAEVLRSFAP